MTVWRLKSEKELSAVELLNDESDRAAAIIAVCLLEDSLSERLRLHFSRDKPIVTKRAFDVRGPLGEFQAKNDLAFMLGEYGTAMHEELEHINWIRNRFAHKLDIKGFETKLIFERCKKLRITENYVAHYDKMIGGNYIAQASSVNETFKRAKEVDEELSLGRVYTSNPSAFLEDPKARFLQTCAIFMWFLNDHRPSRCHCLLGDNRPPLP